MDRYYIKVANPSKNVKFEIDVTAESESAALTLAYAYASERIASFAAYTLHPTDWTARQKLINERVQQMMQKGVAGYWNPAKLDIEINTIQDPVIAFSWDLINKET